MDFRDGFLFHPSQPGMNPEFLLRTQDQVDTFDVTDFRCRELGIASDDHDEGFRIQA